MAVIFGGRSSEHPISCASAAGVMQALDPARYDVVPIGISPKGNWVLPSGDPTALAINGSELPQVETGDAVVLPADPTANGLIVSRPGEAAATLDGVDVVFPVLHGTYGEDGTIQGLLEMAGVPYVGAGVLASAVCMDKEYTKKLLHAAGLPVATDIVLRPGQELTQADRDSLIYPVFVKPARAGSSFGVSRVAAAAELDAAIEHARSVDSKVLIEQEISGHDVECAVLEGTSLGAAPEVSAPARIRPLGDHQWYDFEAKYFDDGRAIDIPPPFPTQVIDQLQDMARRAFIAVDCAGLARVDFFVDDDYTITVNEINTMPGFTPMSVFPLMWEFSGLSYQDLVDRLVQTALRRS